MFKEKLMSKTKFLAMPVVCLLAFAPVANAKWVKLGSELGADAHDSLPKDVCPVSAQHDIVVSAGWTIQSQGSSIADSFAKGTTIRNRRTLACHYRSGLKISKTVCPANTGIAHRYIRNANSATLKGVNFCIKKVTHVTGIEAAAIKKTAKSVCKHYHNVKVQSIEYKSVDQSSGQIKAAVTCKI